MDLNNLGTLPWGTYADISAEQKAELADGKVTYDEYAAAFGRMRACIQQQAGVDVVVVSEVNEMFNAPIPGAAGSVYDMCYSKEFGYVDKQWQTYRANFGAEANAMAECLREHGVTPALTYLERYNQLRALGMDPDADCVWKKIPADAPPSR